MTSFAKSKKDEKRQVVKERGWENVKNEKVWVMVDSVSVQTADEMLYKTTEGSEKAELHMRCCSQQRTFP